MKMLITFEPRAIYGSNFVYLCILTLSIHRQTKWWRDSSSIILAGGAILSARPLSISKNAYNSWIAWTILTKFCILIHVNICLTTGMHNSLIWSTWLCWAKVENLRSTSEKAHNSWIPSYIHVWFKFCMLMYFNIVQPPACKTVTRLHRASFWLV